MAGEDGDNLFLSSRSKNKFPANREMQLSWTVQKKWHIPGVFWSIQSCCLQGAVLEEENGEMAPLLGCIISGNRALLLRLVSPMNQWSVTERNKSRHIKNQPMKIITVFNTSHLRKRRRYLKMLRGLGFPLASRMNQQSCLKRKVFLNTYAK